MADEIKKVNIQDLDGITPAELTAAMRLILFTTDGDTNGANFIDMVAEAVGSIDIRQPYQTNEDIPVGGSGVTITIPAATYSGTVAGVSVWDVVTEQQVFPTILRGNDGTNETVTLISGKEYTGAEINVILI